MKIDKTFYLTDHHKRKCVRSICGA